MFCHKTFFVMILAVFGCTAVLSSHYVTGAQSGPVSYDAKALQDAVPVQSHGEAQASALSNAAGAGAAAAKILNSQRTQLDNYGHEIGRPLLARSYGALSNLYAAALPPRSFVGKIDPVFVRDSYGNVQHITEARIGVVAI